MGRGGSRPGGRGHEGIRTAHRRGASRAARAAHRSPHRFDVPRGQGVRAFPRLRRPARLGAAAARDGREPGAPAVASGDAVVAAQRGARGVDLGLSRKPGLLAFGHLRAAQAVDDAALEELRPPAGHARVFRRGRLQGAGAPAAFAARAPRDTDTLFEAHRLKSSRLSFRPNPRVACRAKALGPFGRVRRRGRRPGCTVPAYRLQERSNARSIGGRSWIPTPRRPPESTSPRSRAPPSCSRRRPSPRIRSANAGRACFRCPRRPPRSSRTCASRSMLWPERYRPLVDSRSPRCSSTRSCSTSRSCAAAR